jgi:O-antigen ligase
MVAFFVVLFPVIRVLRLRLDNLVPALLVLLLVVTGALIVLATGYEQALAFLGKDPTITSRTVIWELVMEWVADRPLLGYGYQAFWVGSPAEAIWAQMTWKPTHAHNGFLELWLDLGLVGLALFLFGVALALWKSIAFVRRLPRSPEAAWPLILIAYMLLVNATQTLVLGRNNIAWILYVANAVLVGLSSQKLAEAADTRGRVAVPEPEHA